MLTRDKSKRNVKPNMRYAYVDFISYALRTLQDLVDNEPRSFQEAMESRQARQWKEAMIEEMKSLHQNRTWILVPLLHNKNVVEYKQIFKVYLVLYDLKLDL